MQLRTIDEAHAPALARGAKCFECPLHGAQRGPVMGELHAGAKLLLVGEAPSADDVAVGHACSGDVGRALDAALDLGELPRAEELTRVATGDVSLTNTVLCSPPIPLWDYLDLCKHEGKPSPVVACRPRLLRDLADHLRTHGAGERCVIAPLGKIALEVVGPALGIAVGTKVEPGAPRAATMAKQHGAPVLAPARGKLPPITLLPTYHPSFAMRSKDSRTMAPIIRADIARAASLARRGGVPDWTEPHYILDPTPQRALDVIEALRTRASTPVTVDIETDGVETRTCKIRCVGLGAKVDGDEVVIVVPVRRMDGRAWPWPRESMRQVLRALGALLDEVGLSGQTLAFDTSVLLRSGLMTDHEKTWRDVAVQHHDTNQSELKHNLGFVGARYFEAPFHKEDADEVALEDVNDADLHHYCARDVLLEMRLGDQLDEEIARCGTEKQFKVDTKILPIAREMGDMGLLIDHEKRLDLFRELTWERTRRFESFRALVGAHPTRPRWGATKGTDAGINPRSVPQIREWLYDVCALPALLNTDGREYDPEDPLQDPSTGEDAVLALIDRGVGPEIERALNGLIEYRGVDKILGTNIGLTEVDPSEATYKGPTGTGLDGGLLERRLFLADRGKTANSILWMPGEPWGIDGRAPIMRIRWALHPVVTGRWSSQPNAQNWSERVVITCPMCAGAAAGKTTAACPRCWDGEGCKGIVVLNTRSLVRAPPGHVMVGADMEQVELRLYAWIANDRLLLRAFKDGLDPHTLNYAAMLTSSAAEQRALYDALMAKGKKHPAVREARNTAKRFCIAEDEPVLVRRAGRVLEVPIQDVACSDEVWDGIEWVTHGGVICNGTREVIEHDGLWATEDHEVWLASGERSEHGVAAARGAALARSGEGRRPLRFVEDLEPGVAGRGASEGLRNLHALRDCEARVSGQLARGEIDGLPIVQVDQDDDAGMDPSADVGCEAALHESGASVLGALRGPGDRVPLRIGRGGCGMGHDEPRPSSGAGDRSDRGGRALRAGELALGDRTAAGDESQEHEAARSVEFQAGGMALRAEDGRAASSCRTDAGADPRGRGGVRSAAAKLVAPRRRTTRVYDILNAGPRRRFTASGRLVHNCYLILYGGEIERLFQTMSAERTAEGRKAFPGITERDVTTWFTNWQRTHPETQAWQRGAVAKWRARGFVATKLHGRKRFFIGGEDRNAMANHEIQGTAGDMMNEATLALAERLPFRKHSPVSGLRLQVHDYLGGYWPTSALDEAKAAFEGVMHRNIGGMDFPIELKVSESWDKQ